jgi:hypothetical protein
MSEITYDGKFSNLEVDKLYTKEKTSSISADQTLTTFDSGTIFFCNCSTDVNITLPAATTAGLKYTFIVNVVSGTFHLALTSASTIYGTSVIYDTSPPGTTLGASSGTTITLESVGLNLLTVGSRIAVISDGTSWYLLDELSNVPLVFS